MNNIYKSMMNQVKPDVALVESTRVLMKEAEAPRKTYVTRQFMPMMAALLLFVGGAAGLGLWLNANAPSEPPEPTTLEVLSNGSPRSSSPTMATQTPVLTTSPVETGSEVTERSLPTTTTGAHETEPVKTLAVITTSPDMTVPIGVLPPVTAIQSNATTVPTTTLPRPTEPVFTTAAKQTFPTPPALKPLTEQANDKILQDYVSYLVAKMKQNNPDIEIDMPYWGDYEIVYYLGTYDGNSVVAVYGKGWASNGSMQYIDIPSHDSGYQITLSSGSYELLVHRAQPGGGTGVELFTEIRDAYVQGVLSLQNIHDISWYPKS